jgi:8-oxo-dGTP pyrophosphatase MutT (NUDIX family)
LGLPKGHAELHETPVETAIRETLEETGLRVVIIKTLEDLEFTDKHERRIRVHYFLATPVEQSSDGEHEQKWVSYNEALTIVLPHVRQYLLKIRKSLALSE